MKNKIDIEAIKLLIPDYISNSLSDDDKKLVEEALSLSPELNEFYKETKRTFDFVGSVKFAEPAPQYWTNLLPRIHQRIEEKEAKAGVRNPLSVIWKVLVPVAAVVLIFIIYRIFTPPEPEITDKNKVQITDESKKDTAAVEKKKDEDIKEEKIVKTTDETKHKKVLRKRFKEDTEVVIEQQNVAEQVQKEENIKVIPDYNNIEEFASMGYEEALILGAGEQGVFDEETEKELERLDTDQQDVFLKELLKSNL